MANWKYELNFSSFWDNDSISIEQKGKKISNLIRHKLPVRLLDYTYMEYDQELEEIVEAFDNITGYDDVSPTEEFDDWMDALYDWADQEVAPFGQWPANKMCWVETFK